MNRVYRTNQIKYIYVCNGRDVEWRPSWPRSLALFSLRLHKKNNPLLRRPENRKEIIEKQNIAVINVVKQCIWNALLHNVHHHLLRYFSFKLVKGSLTSSFYVENVLLTETSPDVFRKVKVLNVLLSCSWWRVGRLEELGTLYGNMWYWNSATSAHVHKSTSSIWRKRLCWWQSRVKDLQRNALSRLIFQI